MFFTNKHVVVAMLVAPVLAIMSYFAVDGMVAEQPNQAQAGQSYTLVEKPNCRYSSGVCGLKNGNFEIQLKVYPASDNKTVLELTSVHSLQRVLFGIGSVNVDSVNESSTNEGSIEAEEIIQEPVPMTANDNHGKQWQVSLPKLKEGDRLRFAIVADGAYYIGESAVAFINYQTAFEKDFRRSSD